MPFRLDRAFLHVSGPDAVSFLDNLLTQDLTKLGQAGVLHSALLSPQGKVMSDMLLWAEGEDVVVEADPARTEHLLRRLSMYKLRARVKVEAVDRVALWSAKEFERARPDPRLSALGWRTLADASDAADGAHAYEAQRLTVGVPDLARDAAAEEVFAGEALLEELHGVDFQKGCFVGQENTSRMKRRATTRKKFCPVAFEGPAPAYGAPISAGAAEIGQIRTGMTGRAMALLRLDRALAAQQDGVEITSEGRKLQLAPPPWLILPPREG